MINATIAGNLGRDAKLKNVGGQALCSFAVASTTKVRGENSTTWVRCSMWGSRGEKLAEFLTMGKAVCVSGGLTTREHDGKTYLELRVDDVKLMSVDDRSSGSRGGKESASGSSSRGKAEPKSNGCYDDADYDGADDDIPF